MGFSNNSSFGFMGGGGASGGNAKFRNNIPVSLSGGKTVGRYTTGETIPSAGLTAEQVFNLIAVEPINPTVNLTSPTSIAFNQSAINNVLNFSYVINSLGASVQSVSLEWRRNNTGSWTVLTTNTALTTYTHSLTDPLQFSGATNSNGSNTQPFNYRYTVTDTAGATATATFSITPQVYATPTISFSAPATSLNGVQTNTLREIGNISSQLQGSISSNRANVALVSYQLQYSVTSGGSWVNIGSAVGISGLTATIPATTHNDVALINSTSIWYRTVVVDTYQQYISSGVGSSNYQITLRFLSYLGFSTSLVIDNALIIGLGNQELAASKVRSVSGVTASLTEYTYIAYPSSYGNLSSIRQNPLQENLEVIGAFTLQYSQASPFSVLNQYGISSNYIVYNTADSGTQSFVNATLALS